MKHLSLMVDSQIEACMLALMTLLHRTAITMANNYSQKCPSTNTLFTVKRREKKITMHRKPPSKRPPP